MPFNHSSLVSCQNSEHVVSVLCAKAGVMFLFDECFLKNI